MQHQRCLRFSLSPLDGAKLNPPNLLNLQISSTFMCFFFFSTTKEPRCPFKNSPHVIPLQVLHSLRWTLDAVNVQLPVDRDKDEAFVSNLMLRSGPLRNINLMIFFFFIDDKVTAALSFLNDLGSLRALNPEHKILNLQTETRAKSRRLRPPLMRRPPVSSRQRTAVKLNDIRYILFCGGGRLT